jgi:D-sedoheptulose 7-phosphate isomerase
MDFARGIDSYLASLQSAISHLDRGEIEVFLNVLMEAYERGSRLFVFGNGGSGATASHFAGDMNKGVSFGLDKRFKFMPLVDNMATITAYSNDVSYDLVFVEQLKNFIEDGDVVIGISGSGNSKNVILAIEYANARGNTTLGITGYDGGKLKQIAKHSVNAGIDDMQVTEDIHMIIAHLTMKVLSTHLGTAR